MTLLALYDALPSPDSVRFENGRYEVHAVLGRGRAHTVYRCRDHRLGIDRAVKVFDAERARPGVDRTRLGREAAILRKLSHPNLVPAIATGEENGRVYLVTELVEGRSLQHRVRTHGTVPAAQAVAWMIQVCSALGQAHQAGVIHRDIRPANVLIDRWDTPRLIDFETAHDPDQDTLTEEGFGLGTLGWSAPEQLRNGGSAGPEADVYGVAATLYWTISGLAPIDLHRHPRESPRWAAVPYPLVPVLSWAMAERPRDRYRTIEALRKALRQTLPALRGERSSPWLALARR